MKRKDIPFENLKYLIPESTEKTREEIKKYSTEFLINEIIPSQKRLEEQARQENRVNALLLIHENLKVMEERLLQEGIELPPPKKQTVTGKKEQKPLQLIDLFKEPSQFNQIIEILADKSFCDRHSYVWKDQSKGNKATFAALMKDLYNKLYLKRDFSKDGIELKEIAKNTFSLSIGSDYARKAKHDNLDANLKELIPYASTLPK